MKSPYWFLGCPHVSSDLSDAFTSLQLNPSKTDFIWFGTCNNLANIPVHHSSLVQCSDVVCNLGVLFKSELTMTSHILKVATICWYILRWLRSYGRMWWIDWSSLTGHIVSYRHCGRRLLPLCPSLALSCGGGTICHRCIHVDVTDVGNPPKSGPKLFLIPFHVHKVV